MKRIPRGTRLGPISLQTREAGGIEAFEQGSARHVHERGLRIARRTFVDYAETYKALARS